MKYSKIVEALDRILYFIGNQGISYRRTQETQTHKDAKNTSNLLGHIRPLFLPKNRGPERVSVMAVFKGIIQVVFYIYVSIYMICENR